MTATSAKFVVITGASSGIGRACALHLAAFGFRVFAGVRKPADGDALRAEGGPRIIPIELDVTDKAQIAAAVATVDSQVGSSGLHGLVNNAGIGTPAPIETVTDEVLRHHFEVNVFGQIAVTQGFLPLIRRGRGRIVDIGSVGGRFAMPFGGPLCASKAALALLDDALRLELRASGIHVSLVEPSAISTPAVDKMLGDPDAVVRALTPDAASRYGASLRAFIEHARERERHGSPPETVATVVHRALTARFPRARYGVGTGFTRLMMLSRWLPTRAFDFVRLHMLGLPAGFGQDLRAPLG